MVGLLTNTGKNLTVAKKNNTMQYVKLIAIQVPEKISIGTTGDMSMKKSRD